MFQYSLISDLHVDTGHIDSISRAPLEENIILAGDIGNGLGNFKFLRKLALKGHKIFAVDGNHEHYANKTSKRTLQQTEEAFYRHMGDVSGLDGPQPQVVKVHDGLYIVGVNGWYQVKDEDHWRNYMNDMTYGALSKDIVNEAMQRQANQLAAALLSLPHDAKAIVVTHTAPSERSLDPKYVGSDGNVYYWSPALEHILMAYGDRIAIWHHGHTHAAVDVKVGGVRILTNPRGYPRENPEWKPLTCQA